VKGQALWWLLNYHDSRWKEFGVDEALKRSGLYDPEKLVISSVVAPLAAPTQLPPAAVIAALTGHAARGAELARMCEMCHRIGDQGVDYAPNLTGFANRETSAAVIGHIRDPSGDTSPGYEGTEIILRDGTIVDGLMQSIGDPVVIQTIGGVRQLIPAARIKSRRRLGHSLMLSADQLGLSAQDLADVVAYLKTQN